MVFGFVLCALCLGGDFRGSPMMLILSFASVIMM